MGFEPTREPGLSRPPLPLGYPGRISLGRPRRAKTSATLAPLTVSFEAGSPYGRRTLEASTLQHTARLPALAGRSPLLRLQSDEKLIALIRRGHHGAFEALVQRYQSRLLAFCRHMLGSHEDAEDVLQEVFAAVLQRDLRRRPADQRAAVALPDRAQPLPEPPAPAPARRARTRWTSSSATAAPPPPTPSTSREEFRQIVSDVQELPETQRTALLLREIDALSYDQIAEAMDTTVPSVKSLLVRARVSLAEASEARLLTCDEVRLELGQVAEGLARTSAPVRRHLKQLRALPHVPRGAAQDQRRRSPRSTRSGRFLIFKKLCIAKLGFGGSGQRGGRVVGGRRSGVRPERGRRAAAGAASGQRRERSRFGRRGHARLQGGRRHGRRRDRHRGRRGGQARRGTATPRRAGQVAMAQPAVAAAGARTRRRKARAEGRAPRPRTEARPPSPRSRRAGRAGHAAPPPRRWTRRRRCRRPRRPRKPAPR